MFVFGLCPVCREDVVDEVCGGGQERWDGHLSIRPGTQHREETATSECSRAVITEGRHQFLGAGSHGHAGVAGGLGSQMVVTGGGGSTGGSCQMGGWEQYAGAHWGVIRETLHMRRDRRCSAGREHTFAMSFSHTYVAQLLMCGSCLQPGWMEESRHNFRSLGFGCFEGLSSIGRWPLPLNVAGSSAGTSSHVRCMGDARQLCH